MKSSLTLSAIILLSWTISLAQQYHIIHYTKDKGLPGNQVWDIYQDRRGYMWFSTTSSLVRYDGKEYRKFRKEDGILEDFALNVREDNKGNIWIGCPGGVSKIQNGKVKNWKLGKFDDFYRVFLDSYDRVWVYNFQFASDLYVIDNDSLYNYSQLYRFKNQRILHISEDNGGGIELLTQGSGMYKFFMNTLSQVPTGDWIEQVSPQMFFFDSHGDLILCGKRGAIRIPSKRGTGEPAAEWLLRIPTVFGIESKNGHYWFATRDSGLYRIPRQSMQLLEGDKDSKAGKHFQSSTLRITEQNGLSTNDLFTLFEDREQNVWVGTNLKGICKLSSLRFLAFGTREQFKSEAVLAIAQAGDMLYCTTEKGIYQFREPKFSKVNIRGSGGPSSGDRFFLCMVPKGNNGWFLGSAPGLYFLDGNGNLELVGLNRLIVQRFFKDSNGDIWIGTNKGIHKLQGGKKLLQEDFGVKNRFVNCFLEVGRRDLYIGTDSGLTIVENGVLPFVNKSLRTLTMHNGLLSDMINDLAASSEGEIVVGTGNGLGVITNGVLYNIVEGFNDRYVNAVMVDRRGRIWAGTDNGLHLLQKIDGKYKVVAVYLQRDGLVSNEFTRGGTMYEDVRGKMWFGTYGGLTVYDPEEEPIATIKPFCYLSSVQVNDSTRFDVQGEKFEFDFTQNKLRFFYEGISFFNEDEIRFEYYVEPLEKMWSNVTSAPSVSYGYVQTGAYTFHVRAVSPLGATSEGQSVSFAILPPIWRRTWFLILTGAIFLVALYQLSHYRLSRISKRNLLLESVVSEKTAELQASKNEIEVQYRRLLDAQKELVEKAKLEKAYEEIEKLKNRLATENIYLKEKQGIVQEVSSVVGRSNAIQQVRKKIAEVAGTPSTILITGETGTGKNLVAEAIHALSERKDRALVTVNCAAIPEGLVESELFGHEKGAFTGASERRLGKFEIADGSTIFLDEIGDMNQGIQAKILSVLQERKFTRVGGNQPIEVNVRIIAATNYDLEKLVQTSSFRQDLFFRLNVFSLYIPPLRERVEDIEPLTKYFIDRYSKNMNKRIRAVTKGALAALEKYIFPGNIRELENIIQRAVIICNSDVITEEDVVQLANMRKSIYASASDSDASMTLEEMEKNYIVRVLERTQWKIRGENGAAEILGMHPNTLRSRMSKLRISFKKTQQ